MCAASVLDPKSPATVRQKEALAKFGCKIPLGLNKGEASDWLDLLVSRVKANEMVTAVDVFEPPRGPEEFVPASTLPPSSPSQTADPRSSPPPAPATKTLYVQLSCWVPVDRIEIVAKAFREARAGCD